MPRRELPVQAHADPLQHQGLHVHRVRLRHQVEALPQRAHAEALGRPQVRACAPPPHPKSVVLAFRLPSNSAMAPVLFWAQGDSGSAHCRQLASAVAQSAREGSLGSEKAWTQSLGLDPKVSLEFSKPRLGKADRLRCHPNPAHFQIQAACPLISGHSWLEVSPWLS